MDFNLVGSNLRTTLQKFAGKAKASNDAQPAKKSKAGGLTSILKKTLFLALGNYHYGNEKILGLEISPHYIRICQMNHSYGKWSLNQLASACMEAQFTNVDIHVNQDLYVENLKILLEKHHIKTKEVAISVPTSASIIKILNMPEMDDEDLAQAAQMGAIWENMVQLNGSINDYSVYYKVLRHKIKPSTSLATKEAVSLQSSSLDSLFSAEVPSFSGSEIPSFTGPEITSLNDPLVPAAGDVGANEITSDSPVASDILSPAIEASGEMQITDTVPSAEIIPEEEAGSMDVLFVATRLADTMVYIDIAQRAGLKPIIIDVKCNALKHAFETNPDKRKIPHPFALLEFGADENYIYIIDNMKVTVRNINVSDDDRQLMTRNVSDVNAIAGLMNNYAQQLHTILDEYHQQSSTSGKIYNIYISSNAPLHVDDASAEPLINSFIKQLSGSMGGYQISSCNFCNHIEVPALFAKKVNAEGNLAAWATVLGLATYKLDLFGYKKSNAAIDQVNLLPGNMAKMKARITAILSTLAMSVILAIVIVLAALSFVIFSTQGRMLSNEINILEPVKGQFDEKTHELQKFSMVMDKVKSLDKVRATLPSNQLQILTVYKNITKSIPEGVWLVDITFPNPKYVEIKGNSINDQNILEFVKQLNNTGGFKKVSLKTMQAQEKTDSKEKSTAPVDSSASPVKKFTMQGDLLDDAGTKKLELIAGGVK